MPRRKKHHKHGKTKPKTHQTNNKHDHIPSNKTTTEVNSMLEDQNMSTTLVVSPTASYVTPLRVTRTRKDSFEMDTPINRISLEGQRKSKCKSRSQANTDAAVIDYTPVKTTPVNKRRSLNRQNEAKLNGTWNVTNLNMLFDSDTSIPNSIMSSSAKVNETGRRSRSSIPKLHSPGKEKPLSMTKSTQTIDNEKLESEKQDLITETPRVSQKILSDIDMSKIQVPHHLQLNNTRSLYNQILKCNNANEININPYLKEKEMVSLEINAQQSRWQKDRSFQELSFFSPQLFDLKSSSTPIQAQKLLSYLKEDVIKDNLEKISAAKLGHIENKIDGTTLGEVTKTPRSVRLREQVMNNSVDLGAVDAISNRRENVNLNTPPLTEKVLNKDKSIKLLGNKKRRNTGPSISKIQNRTSPKISRLVNHSRLFTKNLSYSRLEASRRSALDQSCEVRSPTGRLGMYEKMVNKIKRYSNASAKWSNKMMETCAQLGIQIKNSLNFFYNMCNEKSILDCSQSSQCSCEAFKLEIGGLNAKIGQLNEELARLRQQIEEYHYGNRSRDGEMEKMHEELDKLKRELSTFTELRTELTSLKEQFHSFKNAAPAPLSRPTVSQPASAPPLPPPPPPPPPPMPPMLQQALPRPMLGRRAKSTLGTSTMTADKSGGSRPVISLDEILKVKLKKASERPAITPVRRQRISSTPMVHDDLLRQVKLRKSHPALMKAVTPNLTGASTPGGTSAASSELSTSPASSLNRLLDNSSEVVVCDSGKQGQGW